MNRCAVIGGGASGMMAAYAAAKQGADVTLFEKNEKLGKKLYITGKGRCNLTNNCERDVFFDNVIHGRKFMYSSFYRFGIRDVLDFFEENGLKLKTERGRRVFPVSDKSSDVIRTLSGAIRGAGVKICLNTEVKEIITSEGKAIGLKISEHGKSQKDLDFDSVIVACGGRSYPSTGSDGTGYSLLCSLGHTLSGMRPSLVPLASSEDYIKDLEGLSLRNVTLSVKDANGKSLFNEFGEMLFTSRGISGPLVLTASARLSDELFADTKVKTKLYFEIDLKPALADDELDRRILKDFSKNQNKMFKNSLGGLLPAKLIPVIVEKSGINPDTPVNSITKNERHGLVHLLKHFGGEITELTGWNEAVITRGGIKTSEINPKTLESKLVKSLFVCGEMLDVDALTGGFNLQIAWSTGYLAGTGAAKGM